MNNYSGLSRAVREELEQINEADKLERTTKQSLTTESDNSFWERLRLSIILLTKKAPK